MDTVCIFLGTTKEENWQSKGNSGKTAEYNAKIYSINGFICKRIVNSVNLIFKSQQSFLF